jgi:hypothetical protein
MKVALSLAFAASATAFAPQANQGRTSVAMQAESSRREAFGAAAAAAAAFLPVAANAAVGESPRFSVFGLLGDGTSYSEGAAYGSDQSSQTYSPYSVYGNDPTKALYQPSTTPEYVENKKKVIAESQQRLKKLPKYIERKEWFNVKDELTRYMYETRGAVRGLAETKAQKKDAEAFFKAIELTYGSATLRKGDACMAAALDASAKLEAFAAGL